MKSIKKIYIKNFKKFEEYEIEFNNKINILIGDNEAGKSTVIEAIDLVLSGNLAKLQGVGLESLFNANKVREFLSGVKNYKDLPEVKIEVFLDIGSELIPELNGINHSDPSGVEMDGLFLEIKPDDNYSTQIREILVSGKDNFPYEYYRCELKMFGGKPFNQYNKYVKHLIIDSSQINTEYASSEYIKTVFNANCDSISEKIGVLNNYRQHKRDFSTHLTVVNSRLSEYKFELKSDSKSSLERSITLESGGITIDNHGKGKQSFIKTEFALNKRAKSDLDIILLEEPENHLSHTNTTLLIEKISSSHGKQIFVTTHSSLITTRLGLINASILSKSSVGKAANLNMLSTKTSNFFLKAPNHKVLEFVLNNKVILVEGDAEYILISELYAKITGSSLNMDKVHVIEVGGKCFKRYLELASYIKTIKVAVLTDNDGDYKANCIDNYSTYSGVENIKIFSDTDIVKSTFEICIYRENVELCDELFTTPKRKLSIQDYMLSNKTEAAFELVNSSKVLDMTIPKYIQEAVNWIKQ
jgi:putative ATP-dependent endonuclease of the OLD family